MSIDLYEGREHSQIKHELLRGYLEKLLFIMGRGGIKEITYVDCFAGPWGDESSNLEGTSISIALGILKKVRDALAAPPHNIYDTKYRAIFVEKDKNRYKKLKEYLDNHRPATIECHPLKGDHFGLQDKIIALCGNGFTFFFIDPKGWKSVGIPKLSKLLARPTSEFMITFMYDFFVRFVKVEELRSRVCELLGELDESDIKHLWAMDQAKREGEIVRRYREQLKSSMPASHNIPRSYYATVLDKDKERTKYHMVYLTGHPKGIIEFSRISEKVEIFQRRVRYERKEEASGQIGLYPIKDADFKDTYASDIHNVKEYWLRMLFDKPRIFNNELLADMLEDTGWLESDLQVAFGELLKKGKVENLSMQRPRRTKFVHFEKSERLRRCI